MVATLAGADGPGAGNRLRPYRRRLPCRYDQLSNPIPVIVDIGAAHGRDATTAWLPIKPTILQVRHSCRSASVSCSDVSISFSLTGGASILCSCLFVSHWPSVILLLLGAPAHADWLSSPPRRSFSA